MTRPTRSAHPLPQPPVGYPEAKPRPINSLLLVVVLILSSMGVGGVAAARGIEPAASTPKMAGPRAAASSGAVGDTSLSSSLMQSLVEDAVSSISGQLEGDLVGWVLGSNGSGDSAALAQISTELVQIEQTLQQMAAELQQIENEILTQTCLQQGDTLQPQVTQIDTLWENAAPVNYEYVVAQSKAGTPVSATDLTDWANTVVASMPSALTAIANQIDGSGNGKLYSTCVNSQIGSTTEFVLTDDVYYQAYVQPVVEYWTAIQVKALTMYVEAQHYLACRAAKECNNRTNDISDLPQQVCGQASPGSPAYQSCQLAQRQVVGSSTTGGTRGVLAQQLIAAGAPYTVPRNQGALPAPTGSITSLQQWQQSLTNNGKPPKLGDRWLVGSPPLLSGLPSFANRAAQSGDVIYYATTNAGEQWLNMGPPPSSDSETRRAPVHRYVGAINDQSTSGLGAFLWASDVLEFQQQNSPQNCQTLNSANPCGILKGVYSDETVGGSYAYYGKDPGNGTWQAASGPLFRQAFDGGHNPMQSYKDLGDWMAQDRHFIDVPSATIFITSEVSKFNPGKNIEKLSGLTFTDTGIGPDYPHTYWWGADNNSGQKANRYFSGKESNPAIVWKSATCSSGTYVYVPSPYLPPTKYNGKFYAVVGVMDGNTTELWWATPDDGSENACEESNGPGYVTDRSGAASNPQFRLPVLYVGATTAAQPSGTVTCQEYQGDLGTPVATSRWSGVSQTYSMCGEDLAQWLDGQLGELVPPSAVRQLRASKVKKGKATVTWKAPKDSGHGQVGKYQTRSKGPGKGKAACRRKPGGCWTPWRTTDAKPRDRTLKHLHRGLKPGKVYRIQVRAVSPAGPGKPKTVKLRAKRSGPRTLPGNG